MRTAVIVASALAAAVATTAATGARADDNEKCYGIARAGKNDCQTSHSSCAGTSRRDKQGDAWIYVPRGTCERVVDGSLQAKR